MKMKILALFVMTAAAISLVAQTESPVQTPPAQTAPAAQTPATTQPARRPLSPSGIASAQVLGQWVKPNRQTYTMGGETYQGGKWIDITYGRPLMRGREAFTGSGSDYGKSTIAQIPGGPNAPASGTISPGCKRAPHLRASRNSRSGPSSCPGCRK